MFHYALRPACWLLGRVSFDRNCSRLSFAPDPAQAGATPLARRRG